MPAPPLLRVLTVLAALTLASNAVPPLQPSVYGRGQSSAESERARAFQLLSAAREAIAKTDTSSARMSALAALEIFERLKDEPGIAEANRCAGIAAELAGDQKEAVARYTTALALFDSLGDRRGRALAVSGLTNLGSLSRAEAQRLLLRSLDDARSVADTALEAALSHNLADTLFAAGDYNGALTHLEGAAALLESSGASSRDRLGTIYNSMGRLYRAHGQVETALEYQLRALALHEATGTPFTHLQSLNAVAVTYDLLGDSAQASVYYRRALALAERSSSPRIQDFIRANLATAMRASGDDYASVARTLEEILARGIDTYPSVRYRALSDAYLRLGRLEDALAAAQRSIEMCGEADSLDCVKALDSRSAVHLALGNNAAALADIRAALTAIETVRGRLVPRDFLKQQFHTALEEIYSRAIELQVRQRHTGEALETAELARSRAFIDLLASKDLPSRERGPTGTPPLVFRGATLPSEVAAPSVGASDLALTTARLKSTLLTYWVASDTVFIWVVGPAGVLHTSQVHVSRAKLTSLVRATIRAAGAADAVRGDGEADPGSILTRGARAVSLRSKEESAWSELYRLLIKPVRQGLPRESGALITIVPHGPLAALAFAALQDERGRYLLEDYTLHYAPAGGVLQFTSGRRRESARAGRFLMVADPVPPPPSRFERPMPRLPGARAEALAIASLVPRNRAIRLQGARANESVIRSAVAGKTVLHFATHAIVRDDDPLSSFLALAPAGEDGDGRLTAQEIYGLSLGADLVVLSACRSAGGRVTGDGIATFARAFIYGGVPSIVASLWDVADAPTSRLLPTFYRSWLNGSPKARALRDAQLQLLRELRAGTVRIDTPAGLVSLPEQPLFWAGFALLGEPH